MTATPAASLTARDIPTLEFAKCAGLLPAIVQHSQSGAVLMLGYMNEAALIATLERRRVVFFSRSKQRLWEKGELSGNTLDVIDVVADCDRDTLLVLALPRGPVCHIGTLTCFGNADRTSTAPLAFLSELQQIVAQRIATRPAGSYTTKLLDEGIRRIAQKVGEEGLEVALAGAGENDVALIGEAADLLFHLSVLLQARGLDLPSVVGELQKRHRAPTDTKR